MVSPRKFLIRAFMCHRICYWGEISSKITEQLFNFIPIINDSFLFSSGISSNLILTWFADLFGNPNNPSYIPDFSIGFSEKMTFFERVENTLCQIYQWLGYKFVIFSAANKYSKKYLKFDLEKNRDIFYNTSLLFVPTHFSSHGAFPLVPNIIEVGGIHIESIKELPQVRKIQMNATWIHFI